MADLHRLQGEALVGDAGQAILKCLVKKRRGRWQDIRQVLAVLKEVEVTEEFEPSVLA